jgi:hypothetical protein
MWRLFLSRNIETQRPRPAGGALPARAAAAAPPRRRAAARVPGVHRGAVPASGCQRRCCQPPRRHNAHHHLLAFSGPPCMIRTASIMSGNVGYSQSLAIMISLICVVFSGADLRGAALPRLHRRPRARRGESFMRVHWVAVPEAMRARRVNRRATSRGPSRAPSTPRS